jgi:hypothetical protein
MADSFSITQQILNHKGMNMTQPWECPRCHKINSPALTQCFCEPKEKNQIESIIKINDVGTTAVICQACKGYPYHETECVLLKIP